MSVVLNEGEVGVVVFDEVEDVGEDEVAALGRSDEDGMIMSFWEC